jgi:prephenate dehydratase
MAKHISFQGDHGAYSEMAAKSALGSDIETVPCRDFEDVFESVKTAQVDFGIVPIENSLTGSIYANYDLLLLHELHIVAEAQLRVEHCLIANQGVAIAQVKLVQSHPQALLQCAHTLSKLGVQTKAAYDTAGSVRALRESGSQDEAAIASRLAAETYGMNILQAGIEDNPHNYTRFLFLNRDPVVDPTGDTKTSIVFVLENKPAALFRAMACFALRDIDLTKIESRPIPGSPWQYRFYLDFVGSQHQGSGQRALAHLGELASDLRVLGTYLKGI